MTSAFCLFLVFSCTEKSIETNDSSVAQTPVQHEQPIMYYYGDEEPPMMCGPAGAEEVILPDGRMILVDIPTLCSSDPWYHDDDDITDDEHIEHDDHLLDEKGFIDVTITPH